ncbi:DUF1028 domain-containing protein [Nocardia africana]|uniref:Family of uncharacterized function (DUF1028) n=1 Tax=Nocardia africana TaxID=134964 RepID=A0A378WZ38_9NOCA|nr:DUF1028 domain-containing protein [Nocardia africana]MCC3312993.1 DUF1028 domain-containing protein [Nocardia africana]SUA45664.1 Family of uncharacterised function (DUF1028) [Nocardia africana]
MTYSIVARDGETGHLGVGAQSHFLGVGRLAGWLEPGVGAVATQAFVNTDFGPFALEGLRRGEACADILRSLIGSDEMAGFRQLALVAADGTVSVHTGDRCVPAAAHRVGDGVAVQGNMLASPAVLDAMLSAYENAEGELADKILAALAAGENAGGDARGSQSAFIRVVTGVRSVHPWRESLVDIRVDDHEDPIGELMRLLPRARAFDSVGSVMFAPRVMIGAFQDVSELELERSLEGLEAAAKVLDDNNEAAFWRAVLLARAGRTGEAADAFTELFSSADYLRPFLKSVGAAGIIHEVEQYL